MNVNESFAALDIPLPPAVARLRDMGDLAGAAAAIDQALGDPRFQELRPRLQCERRRLARLRVNYPYCVLEAEALLRREWPDMTDGEFQTLLDSGLVDWRCVDGEIHCIDRLLDTLRLYPQDAPGLTREAEDDSARRDMIFRMKAEGGLTVRITIKASIHPAEQSAGRRIQAWLPVPRPGITQDEIEFLDMTPGGVVAPEDVPQRTIYWESAEREKFSVTYRYRRRAPWADLSQRTTEPDPLSEYLDEEPPHIRFTPYLRALCARIAGGLDNPLSRARAIYDYITTNIKYRHQPDYVLLDPIAELCAREGYGDCGVMAVLFITLCRIAGVPAKWESGLHVTPKGAGCHDWAMFHVAPQGWLWADPSFGAGAFRRGDEVLRRHYFGNLDPCRMTANFRLYAPLTPPDPAWRHDPFDNQLGEMTVDGRGLVGEEMVRRAEVVEFAPTTPDEKTSRHWSFRQ